MRFSKKAEYGLRALAAMARGKSWWAIHDLSTQERIPVKFLEQILLILRRAGLLSSRRGIGGGYGLARAASEIRVGDIVRALDGPVAPLPCASEQQEPPCSCPDPRTCAVRLMMTQYRQQMVDWLDSHTLEDLARMGTNGSTLAFEI